jgi:hypothetical protein
MEEGHFPICNNLNRVITRRQDYYLVRANYLSFELLLLNAWPELSNCAHAMVMK